jgi:hypothetical protein
VAQRPDAKAAKTQATSFTRPAADRIRRVVRIVEAGDRKENALSFQRVGGGGSGKVFRVCTFDGAWNINESKTLTLQNVTTTPNTVSAINQLFTRGDACETQVAYIGKIQSDWHLLNVQHHETAVIVNVTLTTAALEFTRRLMWVPYPGETATLSIPLTTDTACS